MFVVWSHWQYGVGRRLCRLGGWQRRRVSQSWFVISYSPDAIFTRSTDSSVSGSQFSASASPLLAHLVRGAAEDVPHPTIPNSTLWEATKDHGPYGTGNGPTTEQEDHELEVRMADSLGVGILGSGSDYTVFLQRLGVNVFDLWGAHVDVLQVASMSHGFSSTKSDPIYHYHSVYDSERWMEKYGDPGFYRHVRSAWNTRTTI